MGKHVLRRPDHPSHQELAGAEVDVGPDLRVARQERHLLQGEGRQRQLDGLEGKNEFAFSKARCHFHFTLQLHFVAQEEVLEITECIKVRDYVPIRTQTNRCQNH